MTAADPSRRSVEKLKKEAEQLGYRVHEYDEPFASKPFCNDPIMQIDLYGYGELLEARFIRHPETGYWRWYRGFMHNNSCGGDRYPTLLLFMDIVAGIARRYAGEQAREEET